jgi:quercetin dioxygenase-like cupin family protein
MTGRQATARRTADLVRREVVIPPGGSTGWHYHEVPLIAVVVAGTLTRILHDGTVEVHRSGTDFIEPAGRDRVHLGCNRGSDPVVLHVTCALPEGVPFSLPAGAPSAAAAC